MTPYSSGCVACSGLAWLFMGVANSDAKLYDDELQEILGTYPDQVGFHEPQRNFCMHW